MLSVSSVVRESKTRSPSRHRRSQFRAPRSSLRVRATFPIAGVAAPVALLACRHGQSCTGSVIAFAFQPPPEMRSAANAGRPVFSKQRSRGLGEWNEDRMAADPAKPVGGIACIGLTSMRDAMPVCRRVSFSPVVGLLGGVVAGIPEVVHLQEPGRQRQSSWDEMRSGTSSARAGSESAAPIAVVGASPAPGRARAIAGRPGRPRQPWRSRSMAAIAPGLSDASLARSDPVDHLVIPSVHRSSSLIASGSNTRRSRKTPMRRPFVTIAEDQNRRDDLDHDRE